MKRSFTVYIEEDKFYKFIERFSSSTTGSITRRFREAIERAVDECCEGEGIQKELKSLSLFEELFRYRKERGLSKAEDLEEFLIEVIEYLRSDPLFETN